MEKTLAIIKPDAVQKGSIGDVIGRIESNDFKICAARMLHLTKQQAEGFYAVHHDKPFFADLTRFMSEGPILVMVLCRDDAIRCWRDTMGATDPDQAEEGTLRKEFGESIERNAVHGSDSAESAAFEISYFFSALETAPSPASFR